MKTYNLKNKILKKSLKRAILIIQILCICMALICSCSSKANETETETTQAETMPQLHTSQMPLLYRYSTAAYSHEVEIYQANAKNYFTSDHRIFSLAFSVDGEFQFVCDVFYQFLPTCVHESTIHDHGKLPKEAIKMTGISNPNANPNGKNEDCFWISIYKDYNNDVYSSLKYTFTDNGPMLEVSNPMTSEPNRSLTIKGEDINIINEELTVIFTPW